MSYGFLNAFECPSQISLFSSLYMHMSRFYLHFLIVGDFQINLQRGRKCLFQVAMGGVLEFCRWEGSVAQNLTSPGGQNPGIWRSFLILAVILSCIHLEINKRPRTQYYSRRLSGNNQDVWNHLVKMENLGEEFQSAW